MIKEKNINFRINNNMLKYYKEKLNMNLSIGQIIKIDVDDLSVGSHCKITAICDNCGKERIMEYRTYYRNTKNNIEKYYCKKCAAKKSQKTMLEKYGVEHALQLEKFRNKSKDSWFKNYGVNHPSKSKIIKDKFYNTMLEKYGVKNALENKDILFKMMDKTIKKYGMYYVETEEFKEKSRVTCEEKYCCRNISQQEKNKKNKIKNSIKKYGVENPMQNKDIFDKCFISALKMKKYKNTEIFYQGTYEKDFLDLCNSLNILNKIKRGCTIKYDMNEKHLIYFPDFFIEDKNLLIEIKSLYWYNKHKEKNKIKEKTCKDLGFQYLLVMNKKYDEFLKSF